MLTETRCSDETLYFYVTRRVGGGGRASLNRGGQNVLRPLLEPAGCWARNMTQQAMRTHLKPRAPVHHQDHLRKGL